MRFLKQIKNGIIKENPTFVLAIGMCPTLAVTTSAINGLGMGLSTAVVLIGSNMVISAIRKVVPNKIRIPIFIVVIASFVTIVSMLLQAYLPSLNKSLGIFIPLIVVNCIILQRAESFASQNTVKQSMADGIGMGLGFTLALTVLGLVRELIGAGSIFGISIFGGSFEPALIFIQPPGAFLTLGLLMALVNVIVYNRKQKKAKAGRGV
jgi:electron transport complex protein RnfE